MHSVAENPFFLCDLNPAPPPRPAGDSAAENSPFPTAARQIQVKELEISK
jgi:hypothetical protein